MQKYARIIFTVVFVASVVGNIYLINKVRVITSDPAEVNQKEITYIVSRVSKLMVLPSDEIPTLATVSDPEKLKDQPFFARAKIGDKVLVYIKSQKAILYNPEDNKIVEVAPIGGGQTNGQPIPIAK